MWDDFAGLLDPSPNPSILIQEKFPKYPSLKMKRKTFPIYPRTHIT
jgi:hypothetical protein